jgi:toxin-antitoxin system PIN domain toxin
VDSRAFCRATQTTLLRLLTTDAVLAVYGNEPLTNREALRLVDRFLEDGRILFEVEPEGLEDCWRRFSDRDSASPKFLMDAYLAAFAVPGRHELVTVDRAFLQFDGLLVHVLG